MHFVLWHARATTCIVASYLQGFPLFVEQVGDVLRHPLHQVPGVVPLDLKLALLLIINLQIGEHTGSQTSGYPN